MEYTGLMAYTKCNKCGRTIATTKQFVTGKGFEYKTENEDCRYIDRWGFARNFCKACMSEMSR